MHALKTPQRPYTDPWLLPLEARLRSLAAGQRRVAYYYESANNSTFRYRAYNMVQALTEEGGSEVGAAYFFRDDLVHIDRIAALADTLVICRSGYEFAVAQLLSRFRAHGKPVLFDIDDFVFDPDYTHLIMSTLGVRTSESQHAREWQDWFQYLAGMGTALRMCDGAITTNAFLADRIRDYSGKPVAVVPNFMNREQLRMSEQVFEEKRQRRFVGDDRVVVGYFSGSPSHNLDFAIIEQALVELLDQHPRMSLMLVGYIEPTAALAPFAGRILKQPFHDYVNLQRLIGTVDFNLMPLQSNAFTDCKSELKYFEAAAVGTVSIASPSCNYAAAIRHGVNGYIARAHEWQRCVVQALASGGDYATLALAARDDALSRYDVRTQRPAIERALGWC